jgi:hypothetical protein
MEEGPFRVIFGWHIRVVRKSMSSSYIFLLPAVIRTWILFSLRFSQNFYLCHRLESHRDLMYYTLSKSQLSKGSSVFPIS